MHNAALYLEFIMGFEGNLPPEIYSYGNILPRNYYIWVSTSSFCFQSYVGRPFHGVPPSPTSYREGDFFPKNTFHWGQILWGKFVGGLFYMGRLMIRSYQGGGDLQISNLKHFKSENFDQQLWNIRFKIKPWRLCIDL